MPSLQAGDHPITVIIPTYNRADALITCLEHLERQTWKGFAVVVVDDGSQDNTPQRIEEYKLRSQLDVRFERQANAGPARARNLAISLARSPVVLMIGDDIFPTPRFVETHLELHRRRPEAKVAGLGLTRWEEHLQTVTPFMRFLEEGHQFAYPDLLAGKTPQNGEYFYTSNLSVKAEVLRRNPFCERFPKASFEDLELGFRIARKEGLELVFLPDALAYHLHPTSFRQACRRMRHAGWAAHLMYEIWPEAYRDPAGATRTRRLIRKALAPAPVLFLATQCGAAVSRFMNARNFFRAVLGTHFLLGYKDRGRERGPASPSDKKSNSSIWTGADVSSRPGDDREIPGPQ